jgi:hypothetical protein
MQLARNGSILIDYLAVNVVVDVAITVVLLGLLDFDSSRHRDVWRRVF